MPSLTIRNLESDTREELRRVARAHGRSMQDEARRILREALKPPQPVTGESLYAQIRAIVEPIGGIEIELPRRDADWTPPSFE